MEDGWEDARGLNSSSDDHNGDDDSDGYTNLEEFLFYSAGEGDGLSILGGITITPGSHNIRTSSGVGKVIIGN
jgi:hypothetical protein